MDVTIGAEPLYKTAVGVTPPPNPWAEHELLRTMKSITWIIGQTLISNSEKRIIYLRKVHFDWKSRSRTAMFPSSICPQQYGPYTAWWNSIVSWKLLGKRVLCIKYSDSWQSLTATIQRYTSILYKIYPVINWVCLYSRQMHVRLCKHTSGIFQILSHFSSDYYTRLHTVYADLQTIIYYFTECTEYQCQFIYFFFTSTVQHLLVLVSLTHIFKVWHIGTLFQCSVFRM